MNILVLGIQLQTKAYSFTYFSNGFNLLGILKKISNLLGIFLKKFQKLWLLTKMADQKACSNIELRSVIKLLVAEECKPVEISRRISNLSITCFNQTNVYK